MSIWFVVHLCFCTSVKMCSACVCSQLREDFDSGTDVVLDDEHSVHDVAALLKEFLRDMPDPLLPRELYCAFLHANSTKTHTHTDLYTVTCAYV